MKISPRPRHLLALALASLATLSVTQPLPALDYDWVPTAEGTYSWTTPENWSLNNGNFPNSSSDFGQISLDITGNQLINISTPITVGSSSNSTAANAAISIGDSNGSHSITLAATGTGSITMAGTANAIFGTGSGTINDIISSNITISNGSLRLNGSGTTSHTLTISGVISETGGSRSVSISQGIVILEGLNSFSGTVSFSSGDLRALHMADIGENSSLGTGTLMNFGNGSFAGGGTFTYTGAATSTNKQIRLNGTHTSSTSQGTINASGTGAIVFSDTGDIISGSSSGGSKNLNLGGSNTGNNTIHGRINQINQSVNVNKSGAGTWILAAQDNSYTGITNISQGILSVSKLADGGVVSGLGASSNNADRVILNGGTLRYTGAGDTTDRQFSLGTGGGTIEASGTGALVFDNTDGVIAQSGGSIARRLTLSGANTDLNTMGVKITNLDGSSPVGLTKNGAGTWVMTNVNTYTSTTIINGGKLLVDGSLHASSAVTVNDGGTLGGSGSAFGAVTVASGGAIAAGNSVGTLGTGTLNLQGGSTFALELNTSLGTADRVNVNGGFNLGSNDLGDTLLTLVDLGANVGINTTYTIVTYTSWNGNLFNFNGNELADDSSFIFGNNEYTINYDDGLAVTLTSAAIPEPRGLTLLLGALGAGLLTRRRR